MSSIILNFSKNSVSFQACHNRALPSASNFTSRAREHRERAWRAAEAPGSPSGWWQEPPWWRFRLDRTVPSLQRGAAAPAPTSARKPPPPPPPPPDHVTAAWPLPMWPPPPEPPPPERAQTWLQRIHFHETQSCTFSTRNTLLMRKWWMHVIVLLNKVSTKTQNSSCPQKLSKTPAFAGHIYNAPVLEQEPLRTHPGPKSWMEFLQNGQAVLQNWQIFTSTAVKKMRTDWDLQGPPVHHAWSFLCVDGPKQQTHFPGSPVRRRAAVQNLLLQKTFISCGISLFHRHVSLFSAQLRGLQSSAGWDVKSTSWIWPFWLTWKDLFTFGLLN